MKSVVLIVIVILAARPVFGQADIHFSQFYETSILRNPAMTGVFADDYKFGLYYRNQWASISHSYQTYLVSAETHFSLSQASQDFVSLGLLGYSDKAGSLSQTISGIYPALNYNKSINPSHLSFLSLGVTAGYLQYSFDPSKATFNSQYLNGAYDPTSPTQENLPKPKMEFWDFGAGINYNRSYGENNTTTLILGISGYHFGQPQFSYYATPAINLNMRWNGNATLGLEMKEDVTLQLQANYSQQGTYNEIIGGGLLSWTIPSQSINSVFSMAIGALYRLNDAVIPVVRIKYQNVSFGISYDVNVSTLKDASNMQGGTELTLFISGNYKNTNGHSQKLVCPRF
jgi:type IX secretion system PorP/SprF family membrane protein